MPTNSYTAVVEKEGKLYAALCPELDVASQGTTIEEATANLKEAVWLVLECADPAGGKRRPHTEVYGARFEAKHGQAAAPLWTRGLQNTRIPSLYRGSSGRGACWR